MRVILLGALLGLTACDIDNDPANGANGWFARNGGRLILPQVGVNAGTGTYTWGESAADRTLDLVNSVRFMCPHCRQAIIACASSRTGISKTAGW